MTYLALFSSLIGWTLYLRARKQLGSMPRNYAHACETVDFLRRELDAATKLSEERLQRTARLVAQVSLLSTTLKSFDPAAIAAGKTL